MDNTLSLKQFAQMVASSADISADEAQAFLTSLVTHIKERLCAGEKTHLAGIGTFAVIESGGKATVVFAPDDSFAEAVNEPFAIFEPVELPDSDAIDIAISDTPQELPAAATAVKPVADKAPATEEIPAPTPVQEPAPSTDDDDDIPAPAAITHDIEVNTPHTVDTPFPPHSDTAVPAASPAPTQPVGCAPSPTPSRQYRLGWLCLGIAIGAIIGYLVAALVYTSREISDADDYSETYDETALLTDSVTADVTDEIALTDSYPPQSSVLCHDTVTVRRYITHMAKDYYGDRNFWVYIYEANKDVLGHPERTLPGTVVAIPVPSSIPANPSNPDDIKEARRLAAEIYARFK